MTIHGRYLWTCRVYLYIYIFVYIYICFIPSKSGGATEGMFTEYQTCWSSSSFWCWTDNKSTISHFFGWKSSSNISWSDSSKLGWWFSQPLVVPHNQTNILAQKSLRSPGNEAFKGIHFAGSISITGLQSAKLFSWTTWWPGILGRLWDSYTTQT